MIVVRRLAICALALVALTPGAPALAQLTTGTAYASASVIRPVTAP